MRSVNTDVAYDFIRKRILSGEYPPGYALMTELLAKDIKVSRTPVRDALRQLESDGLVKIRARLGASVTAMDLEEYGELCGLRIALESYAAGLAAENRTEAGLHEMRVALDSMVALTEKMKAGKRDAPSMPDLARVDVRFHLAVITASKNRLIKQEILRLQLLNRVVVGPQAKASERESPADLDRVVAGHEEIYRAVEKGDGAGAKDAMERHLREGTNRSLRKMAERKEGALTREFSEEELSYLS